MKQTFRVPLFYWISTTAFTLVLITVMVIGIISAFEGIVRFLCLLIMPVAIIFVIVHEGFSRMWRKELVVDDYSLSGHIGQHAFTLLWQNVLVAQLLDIPKREKCLLIVTAQEVLEFPLDYLNVVEIWSIVKEKVPPQALEKDAYKQLPDYKKWVEVNQNIISSSFDPVRVSGTRSIKYLAWANMVVMTFFSYGAVTTGGYLISLGFVVFALLGVFLLVFLSGAVEVDNQKIVFRNLLGRYEIEWNDVKRIDYSKDGYRLVFYGENKRLSIIGPALWSNKGNDKERVYELLDAQINQRKIELGNQNISFFKFFSVNTRTSWLIMK